MMQTIISRKTGDLVHLPDGSQLRVLGVDRGRVRLALFEVEATIPAQEPVVVSRLGCHASPSDLNDLTE